MTHLLPRILRSLPIPKRQPQGPLDHPALVGLSPRQLSDLPRARD
ncbi:hypothetical protein [uncultured Maritimibacter sp.]|jgi:hypothetical protein|nr:hypothetical protein [uncultured Maritimibacter sp.]